MSGNVYSDKYLEGHYVLLEKKFKFRIFILIIPTQKYLFFSMTE